MAAAGSRKKISPFSIFNYSFFVIVALLMVFPLWNVIVISLTDYQDYVANPLMLFPKEITMEAYDYIFANDDLLTSLKVTVMVTITGTFGSMLCSVAGAYALSKKKMPGRNLFLTLILVTMFFNGGIVPNFLLIKDIGLYDTIGAMVFPTMINTWYLIIMKNYFTGLPEALEESARIDGANDITILLRIILPISMPIIATFTLFYGVDRWNEWWNAMMYINDTRKYPLQLLLRNLIVKNFSSASMATAYAQDSAQFVAKENIKMATAVVAIVPITVVYPFLQKYFAKGVMVGAIKS
ncbi:MAG: carbohydrate ABC transporter permease [bacterium]|nr:carbohydrate ABC transporter permease [bacterium]